MEHNEDIGRRTTPGEAQGPTAASSHVPGLTHGHSLPVLLGRRIDPSDAYKIRRDLKLTTTRRIF